MSFHGNLSIQINKRRWLSERKSIRLRNIWQPKATSFGNGKLECLRAYFKEYVLWFWTKYALIPSGSFRIKLWKGSLMLSKATRSRSHWKNLKIIWPWNKNIQHLIKQTLCVSRSKSWRHNPTDDEGLSLHAVTNYAGLSTIVCSLKIMSTIYTWGQRHAVA
jgi:hypothetical protein